MMNRRRQHLFWLLIVLMGAASASAAQEKPGQDPQSTLGGVFTEKQASRGEAHFRSVCANCHGIREFTSPGIFRAWSGRPIRELLEMVASLMPDDNPGGLERQVYVDVMAYLLAENGYPAGDNDLPSDDGALGRILIEVKPPAEAGR